MINRKVWGGSLVLGHISLPSGFLIRLIPNPLVERFYKARLMPDPSKETLPSIRPNVDED